MKVRLNYTNNPKIQNFIGESGELTRNERNGYTFSMANGMTISTTAMNVNAPHLGDINNPNTRSLYFETISGSQYDFENIETKEKIVDGCFKRDNQFLGFDNERNIEENIEPDITNEF